MSSLRLLLTRWLVAASLCIGAGWLPAAAAPPRGVLIVSEGPILPYGVVLRDHLVAALRQDNPEPLNIYEELIDRVRFDSDEYERQLVAFYKAKYIHAAPALVITITEPALDFALRHRKELFPHAALLFGAVDERAVGSHTLGANVTGVFSHYDARATVEAALTLQPGTRHLVVVGGSSRLDRGYINVAIEDLRGLPSAVAVTHLNDKPLNQVLTSVAALGEGAVVLFLSMQSDGHGVARTGPEVLAALRSVAKVPIYGMSGNFLGRGIVGGVLFEVQNHGAELAQRARLILSGAKADDLIPIRSQNTPAFDWRELERFGIDQARLPAASRVVNRELSLWDTNKRTIIATLAVLVGQFLLIGALLLQRQRRRRAEGALRDLSGRLLSAQEEERRRIARELHDNVSQRMAVLSIRIGQAARGQGTVPSAVTPLMSELRELAAEVSAEIHSVSHRLHSSKLEMLGLIEALRAHCEELSGQGVRVTFHDEGMPRSLPDDVELCLFRIVQESLNNVVKHSGAREAQVTLRGMGNVVVLSVADSGRGFDPGEAPRQGGLGLASMRERLRPVDGQLTIRSQPGEGTTIRVSVPIPKRRAVIADTAGAA